MVAKAFSTELKEEEERRALGASAASGPCGGYLRLSGGGKTRTRVLPCKGAVGENTSVDTLLA